MDGFKKVLSKIKWTQGLVRSTRGGGEPRMFPRFQFWLWMFAEKRRHDNIIFQKVVFTGLALGWRMGT